MYLKLFHKEPLKKTADKTGDLIGNKIADKITVSRTSPQNSLKTVTNKAENIGLDKEIPTERYISPEKRQKTIDDITEYQKMVNCLGNTPSQPFEFKTKNWVKISDARTLKNFVWKSSTCDYSDE